MRIERNFHQTTKAAFAFVFTAATYLLARTTGFLPSWLSRETEDAVNPQEEGSVIPQLDRGIHEQGNELSAIFRDLPFEDRPRIKSRGDGHRIAGQRRLLQTSNGVTVANPIPDQVIQVEQQYTYSLDNVFSGNYSLLGAIETGKNSLPSWLTLQSKLLSTYSGGSTMGVAISGDTAFIVGNGAGFKILDVKNASAPRLLSYLVLTYPQGIIISGNTAFIADYTSGLRIIDVSNLSLPRLLSTFPAQNGTALGIAVSGNTAFLAYGIFGLQILDISNTSNPLLLCNYPSPGGQLGTQAVVISGSIAFVASASRGLQILDVSNTSNPQLLSTYPAGAGGTQGVAVSGNTVFMASGNLRILDVTNTSNPKLLSDFSSGISAAWAVATNGNTTFVVDASAGIRVLDVRNASNPYLLSTYPTNGGNAYGVATSGNMVFVADGNVGLQIIDLSRGSLFGVPPLSEAARQISIIVNARNLNQELNSDSFTLVLDQFPRVVTSTVGDQSIYPGNSLSLLLSSEILFTNPGNSFLKLSLKLSSGDAVPSWLSLNLQPILLSSIFASQSVSGVVVNRSTAFVAAGSSGLKIVDVGQPNNPQLLSSYPSTSFAFRVAISGNTAFVANNINLQILDVSNTTNPKLLSTFPAQNGTIRSIAISGNTAFVANGYAGIQVLDINNTSNPKLLSTYPAGTGYTYDSAIGGNTAFVANNANFEILDVSNTSNPRLLSTYPANLAEGIALSGSTVFLANYNNLQIFNVSNASNPMPLGAYPASTGTPYKIAIKGSTAFVAAASGGLQILDVSNTNNPRLLGIHPGVAGQSAYDVAVNGNTAFLANNAAGLLILDISQWQLTATPGFGDVGNYRLQLIATDELGGTASTQPFTMRVEGPPKITGVIPAQYARVGQFLNYFVPQGLFTDPNFDSISFTATLVGGSALPSWLAFNGFSAAFAGTPTGAANITILLRATDNIAGSVNTTFNIITSYLPVTDLPIAEQIARIGAPYYFRAPSSAFFDRDGDIVNYTAQRANGQSLPSWLRFNATVQSFSGYPNQTEAGQYDLQLTAIDRYNGQASTIFTVWVEHFPVANQTLTNQVVGVGDLLNLALPPLAFTDADSNQLSYRARRPDGSALPNWLGFNPQTLVFNGQPLASDRGTFTVQVVASDPLGASATQNFNLTVIDVPTLGTHIPRQLLNAGVSVQFPVPSSAFSYAGTDPLRYSAYQQVNQSLPSWLQFNNVSLIFSGTPPSNQTADYSLSVVAQDYYAHAVSNAFDLVVERFPVVNQSIASVSASVGNPMTFAIASTAFADPDGDPLTYSARRADGSALPNWLTFDGSSRVFSGIPVVTDIGAMTLQVIATDPLGGSAQQNMTLTILYAPVINTPPPALKPLREDRVFNLTLSAQTFSDPGGAPLNYSAARLDGSPLPSWLTFFPLNLSFAGTPAITDVGTINIQITATNPQGAYVNLPLSLVIWPNYPPQVMQTLSNQIATVLNAFQFFAPPDTFSDVNEDPLHYTATQVNGQPLPGWLRFDPKKLGFSGTPSRSDTGNFAARVIPVALTAHDDKSSTSTQFNISVQGTSGVALFLQVIIPLLSSLATGYTLYRKRALLLNRYKPQRYQQLAEEKVMIGDRYERQLATPVDQVKKVKVMLPHARKDCLRIFMLPYRPLPGGVDLPAWLSYDTNANTLRSKGPIPATASAHLIVQVRGADNVIVEQFPLHIDHDPAEAKELDEAPVVTPALPGLGDEDAIEMQSVNNMRMTV